jgi:hypothetical protein
MKPKCLTLYTKSKKSDPDLIHCKQKTTRPKCLTLYTKNNLTQISYTVNKKKSEPNLFHCKKNSIYMRKKHQTRKKRNFSCVRTGRARSCYSQREPQARRDLCAKWRRKGRKRGGKRAFRELTHSVWCNM